MIAANIMHSEELPIPERDQQEDEVAVVLVRDLGLLTPDELGRSVVEAQNMGVSLVEAIGRRGSLTPDKVDFLRESVEALLEARRAAGEVPAQPVTGEGSTSTDPAGPPEEPSLPSQADPAVEEAARRASRVTPATGTPARRKSSRYTPRAMRAAAETPDIDVDSLRDELNIARKTPAPSPRGTPRPVGRNRSELLEERVRLVLPSMLHYTCFPRLARRKRGATTALRLAEDVGCATADAARVLEDWRLQGLVTVSRELGNVYAPTSAMTDDPINRDLLSVIDRPAWKPRILAWVLDEERSRG